MGTRSRQRSSKEMILRWATRSAGNTSRKHSRARGVLLLKTTSRSSTNSEGNLTHSTSRDRAKEWPCNGPTSQRSVAAPRQWQRMTMMIYTHELISDLRDNDLRFPALH